MNYSVLERQVQGETFVEVFTEPLHLYPLQAPKPEDSPYIRWLEFGHEPALAEFLLYTDVLEGDILEVFHLNRRVLFQGVRIKVVAPVEGLLITPVTHSRVTFDQIDCTYVSDKTYLPGGGNLDATTSLADKAFIVDMPDYLGLRLDDLGAGLDELELKITAVLAFQFSPDNYSNKQRLEVLL